jgi:hypothetical protein
MSSENEKDDETQTVKPKKGPKQIKKKKSKS